MEFIETHAHLDHHRLNGKRDELLQKLPVYGIQKVIVPAISYESNFQARQLFHGIPWIFFAPGIHPNCMPLYKEADECCYRNICTLAALRDSVAIKTGLDYYRATDKKAQERQQEWFHRLIHLAQDRNMPLILHIRQANDDALNILKEEFSGEGIVHCFCGDYTLAMKYIALGFCLGIGGAVTRPDMTELRHAVRRIPEEYIVLETDSPFVMPEGCSGKTNTPLNLPIIAQAIADIRGISVQQAANFTTRNVKRIFWNNLAV